MKRYSTAAFRIWIAAGLAAWLVTAQFYLVSGATHYVCLDSPNPTPPYTDWVTAAHVIQEAVDAAAAGDEIVVTNGTYTTGGRVMSGANRVVVDKPVILRSVNGPEVTIILGSQAAGGGAGVGAVRCVYLATGARLSGFTLTNGAAARPYSCCSEDHSDQRGGGLLCESTNAFVSNSVLAGNTAGSAGGGAWSGTLNDCAFTGNSAWGGGGASGSTLNNCTLTGNWTWRESAVGGDGGGVNGGTLNNCTLSGNSAGANGGGVHVGVLNNCRLIDNSATDEAGGAARATLNNCILINNTAAEGGGVSRATLNNCALSGNRAARIRYPGLGGGAIWSTLNNCTVTGSSADQDGGGAFECTLNNCIVYANTAPDGPNYSGSTLNYCCTTPLPASGKGNIELDPQLADASQLSPTSPCRGMGSAAYATGVDIDGEAWANPPSIGCDEFYGEGLAPVIWTQPVGRKAYVGRTVTLSVGAYGSWPLAFQWSKDGVEAPGATNATLLLPNVSLASTGDYTVVVTNALGSVTSSVARVTVSELSPDDLTDGLLAYYPFNGNAIDETGNGNDGQIVGSAALTMDRFGNAASAYHFDGVNGCVEIAQSTFNTGSSEYTICGWFCTDDTTKYNQTVFNTYPHYALALTFNHGGFAPNTNRFGFYVAPCAYPWNLALSEKEAGYENHTWHHFAFTKNGSRYTLFIDGDLDGTQTAPEPTPYNCSVGYRFGNISEWAPETFKGSLDDFRIYTRALSEAEVKLLYGYEAYQTNKPPSIALQPASQKLYAGEAVRLSVGAYGSWPLAFQWRKEGVEVSGATNATLILPNVTVDMAGDYTVVVSNAMGSVTSEAAHLAVSVRPWPYFEDFEGAVGREWSNSKTDVTPVGKRRFLGQFGNDTVSLTLTGLPAHQQVEVSFDLYVMKSWDGDGLDAGPDIWDLTVGGGRVLLHTTFSNTDNHTQTYPGDFPGDSNPIYAGAVEINALGYSYYGDSVYHLDFSLPHTGSVISFEFSAQGLEGVDNESWGLDDVRVVLSPAEGTPFVATELSPLCQWSPANGPSVHQVATDGTLALVTCSDSCVRLLDLTDMSHPTLVGAWTPLLGPTDAVLVGNLAYIASCEPDFLSTIEIVDFTDPAKPVLKGYFDTAGHAQTIQVIGNTAHVADGEAGLLILDVSDPVAPRKIGGYDTLGDVRSVEVAGRYAYVADGNWLLILDVSNPSVPTRAGVHEVPQGIQTLRVAGQQAYVADGSGNLSILDVSNPRDIRLLGTYRIWGTELPALTLAGGNAYLARGKGGLAVLDVSIPTNALWIADTLTARPAEDVAIMGDCAVVAAGDSGLKVFEFRQQLYPPLKAPVLSDGMLTLLWPAMDGIRLQETASLAPPDWQDVPGSESANTVTLPATEAMRLFRLVRNSKP